VLKVNVQYEHFIGRVFDLNDFLHGETPNSYPAVSTYPTCPLL